MADPPRQPDPPPSDGVPPAPPPPDGVPPAPAPSDGVPFAPPPEPSVSGTGVPIGPRYGSTAASGPAVGDAAPPVAPPKPRRRWPWIVLVLLLLAASGVAATVALDQRDVAEQWQERAEALEAQREEALERGDAIEDQIGALMASLEASEADVADLEERIRQLADEKAQAEDEATTVQVERDVVADLTADIAAATDALDVCVDRLFDLQSASVAAFNQSTAGEEVDVEPLNAQARETTQFCNDARSAAARASSAAQQLSGP